MPSSRYCSTATLSRRFDNFLRCSLTSTGTCAHVGGATLSAFQIICCFGVFGKCSSARTTCVMFIIWSSTTLARRNIGDPLPRKSTKSSMVALSNFTSPRTRSCTTVSPAGTRKRKTRPGPASKPRSRLKPSYPGLPDALARSCTCSPVRSQKYALPSAKSFMAASM